MVQIQDPESFFLILQNCEIDILRRYTDNSYPWPGSSSESESSNQNYFCNILDCEIEHFYDFDILPHTESATLDPGVRIIILNFEFNYLGFGRCIYATTQWMPF